MADEHKISELVLMNKLKELSVENWENPEVSI